MLNISKTHIFIYNPALPNKLKRNAENINVIPLLEPKVSDILPPKDEGRVAPAQMEMVVSSG